MFHISLIWTTLFSILVIALEGFRSEQTTAFAVGDDQSCEFYSNEEAILASDCRSFVLSEGMYPLCDYIIGEKC